MTNDPGANQRFPYRWWIIFVLLLTGLGIGLHILLPPAPRWIVEGKHRHGRVSSDGKLLVTIFAAGYPGTTDKATGPLEAWDTATGRLLSRVWPELQISRMVNSRDFRRFAVIQDDKTVAFADMVEGKEWTITLPAESPWICSATYPPIGEHFLFLETTEKDSLQATSAKLNIVHVGSGKLLATIPVHRPSWDMQLSPREDLLFFRDDAADGKPLTVWSMRGQRVLRTLPEIRPEDSWKLSDDGNAVTAVRTDLSDPTVPNEFVRWDLHAGTRKTLKIPSRFDYKLSPDSRILLGLGDTAMKAWSAIDLRQLWNAPFSRSDVTFAFSADSRFIVVESKPEVPETLLACVDAQTGKTLWEKSLGEKPGAADFSRDSRFLFVLLQDGVEVLDVADGKCRGRLPSQQSWDLHRWGNCAVGSREAPPPVWESILGDWSPFPKHERERIVTVAHIATATEVFCVRGPKLIGEYLSPGGQMLITESAFGDIKSYAAWDIPARPRWGWIAGLPAALGFVALALRRWKGHMRSPFLSRRAKAL